MDDIGLIILIALGVILVIGVLIRSLAHKKTESRFDEPVENLVSTEIQGDHYVMYFDASKFPTRSDDPSDSYHTYIPRVELNKTGWVLRGDWIATVKIVKRSLHTNVSAGSYLTESVFKEYHIHSPYDGFITSEISNGCKMNKFPICELKPGTEDKKKAEEKVFLFQKYGVSEEYYNEIAVASKALSAFKKSICLNISAIDAVASAIAWPDNDKEGHVNYLISVDALRCFEGSGSPLALDTVEGFGLMSLAWALLSENNYPEYKNLELFYKTASQSADYIQSLRKFANQSFPNKNLVFPDILTSCGHEIRDNYLELLSRWATIVANADGSLTEEEKELLEKLAALRNEVPQKNYEPVSPVVETPEREPKPVQKVPSPRKGNPMKELERMVGLSSVKEEIKTLYNFVKIQKMRQDNGMQTSSVSYHCVFTGNPGTGKTTVARIVAEIYRDLGILKKGHLIETDRSGLVAEYVGQTAVKTNKIIDSALDGILFIDEAYSLAEGGLGDFGREAIATLLKRMEDDRDRLVVILAGYSSNMKMFIDSNPGLQSRFNRYIDFPDYSSSELYDIFMLSVKKNEYTLTEEADTKLKGVLDKAVAEKDSNFGNGRFVRNLFEKTIQHQANRIAQQQDINNEMLSQIVESDIYE